MVDLIPIADELDERLRILDYVRRLLKEEQMFEVKTKTLGPIRYVSRTANMQEQHLRGTSATRPTRSGRPTQQTAPTSSSITAR